MADVMLAEDSSKWIEKGDAARERKNWLEARNCYRRALEIDGGLAAIWVQYGHALKESGSPKDAEAAYLKAGELAPEVADTHLQLGHVRKLLGRARAAERDYLTALRLDPASRSARGELTRLGWTSLRLREEVGANQAATEQADATKATIALELSDLVDFLQGARYPTGIQRVQLSLAAGMCEFLSEQELMLVYFDHGRSAWVEIDRAQIADIIELVGNAARNEEARCAMAARLMDELRCAPSIDFPKGSILVNPGTSWSYLNYFLAIRDAKRQSAVRYVPLVHDCIPILMPEFCNPDLVRDYINWVTLMFAHADLVLTNSDNTKRDLQDVARQLKDSAPPLATIRLNGEFASSAADVAVKQETDRLLKRHNLDVDDFVLFVSTIEPRKNHDLALSAWSRMLKSATPRPVPRLVCVGSSGWMNESFYNQLMRDERLGERVLVLNNISDQALSLMYEKCLFTIFPSLYEGWGLPISESLAHGKVPLVSRVSSHPEAGGDLAVFFDVNSEADFYQKLVGLIEDRAMLRERELKIRKASPLRPWRQIGEQIEGAVRVLPALPRLVVLTAKDKLPSIDLGLYYSFARNGARRLDEVVHSGDRLRLGMGWHAPESWGCWVRDDTADIGFELPEDAGSEIMIHLQLNGSPNVVNTTVLSVLGSDYSRRIRLGKCEVVWQTIVVRLRSKDNRNIELRLKSEHIDDFARSTEGKDLRRASIGVSGLYVCNAANVLDRLRFIEARSHNNNFEQIGRRFKVAAEV